MRKFVLILAFVALATPAFAQTTLDATYKVGREYDIPQREFTIFHIPGLELALPPVTGIRFKATMWFDAFDGEKVRTDLFFNQQVKVSEKWVFVTNFGTINYYRPFTDPHKERRVDWVLNVEAKFRLKQW